MTFASFMFVGVCVFAAGFILGIVIMAKCSAFDFLDGDRRDE